MSEGEFWKDVVGYEGQYQVSNIGNVRSVERKDSMGRKCGGFTLRQIDNRYGYLYVMLYKNGIGKHKKIHRLVSEAFLPNPNNYSDVNHLDEIKANNNVENLEWCTRAHNINHGTRTERARQSKSKKVRAVNVETGEVTTFSSPTEAGDKGYYTGNVYLACKGNYRDGNRNLMGGDGRTYKGHKWSYE